MLDQSILDWIESNRMGFMFMVSELQEQTGVNYSVRDGLVTFDAGNSLHPIALKLDGLTVNKYWQVVDIEEPLDEYN